MTNLKLFYVLFILFFLASGCVKKDIEQVGNNPQALEGDEEGEEYDGNETSLTIGAGAGTTYEFSCESEKWKWYINNVDAGIGKNLLIGFRLDSIYNLILDTFGVEADLSSSPVVSFAQSQLQLVNQELNMNLPIPNNFVGFFQTIMTLANCTDCDDYVQEFPNNTVDPCLPPFSFFTQMVEFYEHECYGGAILYPIMDLRVTIRRVGGSSEWPCNDYFEFKDLGSISKETGGSWTNEIGSAKFRSLVFAEPGTGYDMIVDVHRHPSFTKGRCKHESRSLSGIGRVDIPRYRDLSFRTGILCANMNDRISSIRIRFAYFYDLCNR
jgi:hypothetical protein